VEKFVEVYNLQLPL